jgi:hypothetical protein
VAHYQEHRCSGCDNITSPELLTVKKAVFYPKGQPKKTVKSVVLAWLCEACLEKDPDFNRPPYSGPGHTSPALQRVREDRVVE